MQTSPPFSSSGVERQYDLTQLYTAPSHPGAARWLTSLAVRVWTFQIASKPYLLRTLACRPIPKIHEREVGVEDTQDITRLYLLHTSVYAVRPRTTIQRESG